MYKPPRTPTRTIARALVLLCAVGAPADAATDPPRLPSTTTAGETATPQTGTPARNGPALGVALSGRVVDAQGGGGIAAALVALVRVPAGEEPPDSITEEWERRHANGRQTTGPDGAYRFDDVGPGLYLVRVTRIGYRSATVRVLWRGPAATVSVALRVEPIELEPLDVRARGEMEVRVPGAAPERLGRVAAERVRQESHLTSDARIVGAPDIREAATLGEMDVFRALQRLPGVSTRDDYTAELWTRGASWGETRVYMDGLPLFNPLHGFGLLSGVSHRGLGAAYFHPGVRPARVPEGGAAVIELTSASGAGLAATESGLDLTLASAHAWARGALGDDGGWSATARRSWADLAVAAAIDDPDAQLPYAFSDLLARVDLPVGDDAHLEVSGFHENDAVRGEIPDVLHRSTASWGNTAGQATLTFPLGALAARQSIGVARYGADVQAIPSEFDDDFSAPSEPPSTHRVSYLALRGELGGSDGSAWTAAYDVVHQSARYEGPEPWPYSGERPERPATVTSGDLTRFALWGRHRWTPLARLDVESGLRVEAGSATAAGRAEVQPSLSARLRLTPDVSLSTGVGRYVQYAQSPASMGPVLSTLEAGRLWVVAGPGRAPLVARIATVGGEAWLGGDWLLSTTAYGRWSSGVVLPDPTPGLIVQRPPLVTGRVRATGVEIGLRRLTGRVTGSLGYSLGRARAEAVGRTFDAPTDRRHVVDATAHLRLLPSLDVQLAYTWASGAPYTRVLPTRLGDGQSASILERPFELRAPAYSGLDAVLEWTNRFDGWTLGVFVQGRNLLRHDNAVTYRTTALTCPPYGYVADDVACDDGAVAVRTDRFLDGIPIIPLLGLRVTF
jgi:hypothetical protein